MVRLAAVTHGFDQNQRYVPLEVAVPVYYDPPEQTVTLSVTAPANENVAPPGYYMLFVLADTGAPQPARYVPSVAHYFQLFKE